MNPNTGPDDYLPIREVGRHLPGRRKPHKSTIHRWWKRGVRGERLQTTLIAGRRFTRIEWIEQFLAAINGNESPGDAHLNRHREQAIHQAESDLLAEGV